MDKDLTVSFETVFPEPCSPVLHVFQKGQLKPGLAMILGYSSQEVIHLPSTVQSNNYCVH